MHTNCVLKRNGQVVDCVRDILIKCITLTFLFLPFWLHESSAKPKGVRLGYMGHLTFISDEVVKLFERYPHEIVAVITDSVELETWSDYVSKGLRDTKERDRVPLGGARPAGHDGIDGTNGESEEDDNEDPMEPAADGDLEKEQVRTYRIACFFSHKLHCLVPMET